MIKRTGWRFVEDEEGNQVPFVKRGDEWLSLAEVCRREPHTQAKLAALLVGQEVRELGKLIINQTEERKKR